MNERFKELAVQSDLWRMLEEYSWEFGSCDPEKDCGRIEKFAELIVRECIDAIDAARPYHTNDHLVNDYMNGVEHGHKFAITMIRKHFGVEE